MNHYEAKPFLIEGPNLAETFDFCRIMCLSLSPKSASVGRLPRDLKSWILHQLGAGNMTPCVENSDYAYQGRIMLSAVSSCSQKMWAASRHELRSPDAVWRRGLWHQHILSSVFSSSWSRVTFRMFGTFRMLCKKKKNGATQVTQCWGHSREAVFA